MEYHEFEKKLIYQLKNDDQDSINTVLNNRKLIQEYLQNTEKPIHIKSLVDGINDIIVSKRVNFGIIEKVLIMESMKCVLSEFRSSDVMLLACKKRNIMAVKWLLQMNINPYMEDDNGMTVLMQAAKNDLLYYFPQLIGEDNDYINILDKNNENALFYAINNLNSFNKLLETNINVNNINKQNDNVLLYSCRYDLYDNVYSLLNKPELDYNQIDKEGRTALMYLLDHEYYMLFSKILNQIKKKDIKYNINYRSKLNNESILSIFIKKYYEMYCNESFKEKSKEGIYLINCIGRVYAAILSFPGFDINIPIDENGNTAIMVFIMMNDLVMVDFTLSYYKDIDLGIKNKYGINGSVLTMSIKEDYNMIRELMRHKTFDIHYTDEHNNNILMYSVFFRNEFTFSEIANEDENEKLLKHVNDKNEDAIILGTKLGIFEHINNYNIRNANVNQQDHLGNSALFYAVKLKNKYDINLLALCHADPDLKNNQGMSPVDLAKQLGEEDLIKIMRNPKPIYKMRKELESSKGSGFSLFGRKKNSDEKIEKYIKNYQINNLYEEYKEFVERAITYTANPLPKAALKQLAVLLYYYLDKCPFYMITSVDINAEYENYRLYFHRHRHYYKNFEAYLLNSYEPIILRNDFNYELLSQKFLY